MRWFIKSTGLEEAPAPIVEILEFRSSRFYRGAHEMGPLVLCILEDQMPDEDPLWIFACDIQLEEDDLDPPDPDYYWHPADDPSFRTSSNYGVSETY